MARNGKVIVRQYIDEYEDDDDGESTQDDGLWSGDGCQWAPTCSGGDGTGGGGGYTSLSDFINGVGGEASWDLDIDVRATVEGYLEALVIAISEK